jgi:hypothetical protein
MTAGADLFINLVGRGFFAFCKNLVLLNHRLRQCGVLLRKYEDRAIDNAIKLATLSEQMRHVVEKVELRLYQKGHIQTVQSNKST